MKKFLPAFFLFSIALILGNCGSEKTSEQADNQTASPDETLLAAGFKTLIQSCGSCHAFKPDAPNQVAPSLADVKSAYSAFSDEEEFVKAMAEFLNKPVTESARMPKAVDQFGLMPNMSLPFEQYEAVATYLFQTPVEDPKWHAEQFEQEKKKHLKLAKEGPVDYLKAGQELALSTKAVLGKNLLNAIKTKGTADALTFCNERAIHLTDSMSAELNATIKRVSDFNRNPGNAANEEELAYIAKAKKEITENGKAKPVVREKGAKMVGYYPIMTNKMCMQCHGSPGKEINQETLSRINTLYPDDKAHGYKPEQLRGIWVVEFDM